MRTPFPIMDNTSRGLIFFASILVNPIPNHSAKINRFFINAYHLPGSTKCINKRLRVFHRSLKFASPLDKVMMTRHMLPLLPLIHV